MADNQLIPQIVKKVTPAVVAIVVAKSLEDVEKEIPVELMPMVPFKKPFLEIPESEIDVHGHVKVGGGSGFIVDADGLVLTNRHVVMDPNAEYTIVTIDDKRHEATVLARDEMNDIAILKIKGSKFPFLKLGDSLKIELGEGLIAFGNALGMFRNTVSSGLVSGLARSIRAFADVNKAQDLYGLIQTDAAINPGNSGGPLVNMNGEVIAINTAVVMGAQNVGFAIPINSAKQDLKDYKKNGKIVKPYLGVRYIVIDEELQEKRKLPFHYGALVMRPIANLPAVVEDSPAAKAGILEGDIILEADAQKVTIDKPLQEILNFKSGGDTIIFKIYRNKQTLELKIKLDEKK